MVVGVTVRRRWTPQHFIIKEEEEEEVVVVVVVVEVEVVVVVAGRPTGQPLCGPLCSECAASHCGLTAVAMQGRPMEHALRAARSGLYALRVLTSLLQALARGLAAVVRRELAKRGVKVGSLWAGKVKEEDDGDDLERDASGRARRRARRPPSNLAVFCTFCLVVLVIHRLAFGGPGASRAPLPAASSDNTESVVQFVDDEGTDDFDTAIDLVLDDNDGDGPGGNGEDTENQEEEEEEEKKKKKDNEAAHGPGTVDDDGDGATPRGTDAAERITQLRAARAYFVIRAPVPLPSSKRHHSSSSKHHGSKHSSGQVDEVSQREISVLEAALKHLGYREANSVSDAALLWVVAPGMRCEDEHVVATLNALSDVSEVIALCSGDANTVQHFSSKNVYDQRLRWYSEVLTRSQARNSCPRYEDFVPETFFIGSKSDLAGAEALMRSKGLRGDGSQFVVKQPTSVFENRAHFPLATHHALAGVKKLQRHSAFRGVVLQKYIPDPMLWGGRKFTVRSWAVVARSSPLLAYYRDGLVYRSLEPYGVRASSSKHTSAVAARFANITNIQEDHPHFAEHVGEAFGCLDEFQDHLNEFARGTKELSHYVDLILRPQLKRIMRFVLLALRKEHARDTVTVWAVQHWCFDFLIDSSWNVWLLDVGSSCPAAPGGPTYTSDCKQELQHALGADALRIAEQMVVHVENPALGKFQRLIDERATELGTSDVERELCETGGLYKAFQERQTFGRRIMTLLFPADGKPPRPDRRALGLDRRGLEPWKCSRCGYLNGAQASSCDQCGGGSAGEGASGRGGAALHGLFDRDREEDDPLVWDEGEGEGVGAEELEVGDAGAGGEATEERIVRCSGEPFRVRDDTDLAGGAHAFDSLRSSSELHCCESCAAHPDCSSFVFRADVGRCELLSGAGARVVGSPGAVSGESLQRDSGARAPLQRKSHWVARLEEVLRVHDPSKVPRAESLLSRHVGEEDEYIERTLRQYLALEEAALHRASSAARGAESALPGALDRRSSSDEHGLAREDYRDRLIALFEKHDPQKLVGVEALLDKFAGREMKLLEHLGRRYGGTAATL